ncbi:MAG: T9SS type A sorting domain-containing protein [Chitinophagaceae bacterium]
MFVSVKAQTNLVPNPSFEQYTTCPTATRADKPDYWFKPDLRGAAYCNACSSSPYVGVPYNLPVGDTGFQYARTGSAYIGMFYLNGANLRNYYEVQLWDSLRQGQYYYAECFVSLQNPFRRACNNQSMLFTKNAVYVDTANAVALLPANPQITNYGNPIIKDTQNWVRVSGIFKAQGGEQYLTLGNFKNDANTAFSIVKPTGYYGAGYYVDDVAVYALDSFCLKADAGKDITIQQGDSAFIGSYTNGIDSLKWYANGTSLIDSLRPGFYVHPNSTTLYVLHQIVNGCFSSDTVYVNVLLPLEFISYNLVSSLQDKKQSIENIWQTVNEINVSHFNIQHCTNGKDFSIIGNVKAQNKITNDYTFIDETPNEGLNYYRIQSVDFDGRQQYTETKTIKYKPQVINGISIYPNPATTNINITSQQFIQQIKLINQLGQTLQQFNNLNTKNKTINIEQFSKGVYVVQIVTSNGEIKTQKIVIK